MAVDQSSNWDEAGTEPPAGEAKYVVSEQPIAEYDNYFNYSVAKDIENIIAYFADFFKKDGSVTMTGDFCTPNTKKIYFNAAKTTYVWAMGLDTYLAFYVNGSTSFSANDSGLLADVIAEKTTDSGVTVDSCLIKDGSVADSLKLGGSLASSYTLKSLFDAYSILYADTDNTPVALTVAASRFVGRKAAGGIAAMTVAEAKTLLAIVVADISDHDKAAHDALNINADQVDGKEASELQFAQNEEISLGSIPLSIYTLQSVTGTTHTKLKMIDNSTDLIFRITEKPTAPSGWTMKGRLYAILKAEAMTGYTEIYNDSDSTQVVQIDQIAAVYQIKKSALFTLPATTKNLSIKMWHSTTDTVRCGGAWIELIAVKD